MDVLLPLENAPALQPIDNVDGDGDYTAIWGAVENATAYSLEEDIVASFARPSSTSAGPDLSHPISGKGAGRYYYRALACHDCSCSDPSNVRYTDVLWEAEPNDEPLWSQIRLNVGAFMHNLFRQGAFQGTKPKDAYFVKCDAETTTQTDRNLGIVNILVGFAPLKPAEFVIIKISQIAGDIPT